MNPSVSLTSKDRLRRSKSARSFRRSHQTSLTSEPFDPEIANCHATAAASRAMLRSSERSSTVSRRSYDRLGGPSSVAVPQRKTRPASYVQASEDASIASDMDTNDNDQTSSAALPPISEFRGFDGGDSSLPSSYRRLRKARSMFSTRQRSSHISYGSNSSESHYYPSLDREQSDGRRLHGTLRQSMSFRRGNQTSKAVRHTKSQEAAIQLARIQFQQTLAENRSPQSQSSLFIAQPRREHKPFRKTFRTTSGSGMDADASPRAEHSKKAPSRGKARAFSSSIKKGLKRVLALSKPPNDQVRAHTSPNSSTDRWNRGLSLTTNGTETDYSVDGRSSHNTVSPSRPPTVRSTRSSESIATSRSRVTSWADSTAGNTIAARKVADRNHLSIIDEQGGLNDHFSNQGPPPGSSPVRPDASIDSKRLYAAIMKRIGRDNKQGSEEEVVLGQVKEHRLIPTKTSSIRPRRSRQTIRQVPSDESITTPRSFATANGGTITPHRHSHHHSQSPLPVHWASYLQSNAGENLSDFNPIRRTKESAFVIGEDSDDDDTRSVIIAKSQTLETMSNSPSVYSRTTSGNSPTQKDRTENTDSSGTDDEPGMVTIYESRRTAYSSPKRALPFSSTENQTRPSADWQQWMNSEVAKIEICTPARDHYREDAQILDEDAEFASKAQSREVRDSNGISNRQLSQYFHGILAREALPDGKVAPESNFSRPFSRSSSVRTIVRSNKEHLKDHASNDAPSSSASVFSSPNSTSNPDSYVLSINGIRGRDNELTLSPMQSRSSNRLRVPDSPTPKRDGIETQQPRMANEPYRKYSTRRIGISQDARTRHCRSTRGHRDSKGPTNENRRADELFNGKGRDTYTPMSSKHMVEMFLNSRHRQIGTEMSDDSAPSGAFI